MQARKAREYHFLPSLFSSEAPRPLGNNSPIIMISSSPTALITMHNVKRFLQESVYALLLIYSTLLTPSLFSALSPPKTLALAPRLRETFGQKTSSRSTANELRLTQVEGRSRPMPDTTWLMALRHWQNSGRMHGTAWFA